MKRLLSLVLLTLLIVTGAIALRHVTANAGAVQVAIGSDPVPPTPWSR
jgi:hypothetical protein